MVTLCYHLRNCQTILQNGCIILHSHQQYMRVLIFPHFCQQVVLKGSPFAIMSMCSSLELANVGKRVFFSDIINFKMLRPWVDPKSNDKCPYERDTEERPKRRESRMQKKAQTGAKNPVQGIPLASRRGHEWIRISLKPLEGVLPTP